MNEQETRETLLLLEHCNINQVDIYISTSYNLLSPKIKLSACNISGTVASINKQL